jgi:hypothetical protein
LTLPVCTGGCRAAQALPHRRGNLTPCPLIVSATLCSALQVAVTSCNGWHLTAAALSNLATLSDDIDVVLIDDNSEDGTAAKAEALGFFVMKVRGVHGLRHAWRRHVV